MASITLPSERGAANEQLAHNMDDLPEFSTKIDSAEKTVLMIKNEYLHQIESLKNHLLEVEQSHKKTVHNYLQIIDIKDQQIEKLSK